MDKKQATELACSIQNRIRDYFCANNLRFAVYGLSGGIDSAVIAGLLANTPGVVSVPIMMPCESSGRSIELAMQVIATFGITNGLYHDLTPAYHQFAGDMYCMKAYSTLENMLRKEEDEVFKQTLADLPKRKALALGNIKARLRMTTLYHYAGLLKGCVVSTDNYSELCMGFWTLHGDVGDISPIQFLLKSEVKDLTKAWDNFPQEILDAAPTDGLDVIPGGTDEDQIGMSYSELDNIIVAMHKAGLNPIMLPNQPISTDQLNTINNLSFPNSSGIVAAHNIGLITKAIKRMRQVSFKHTLPVCFSREEIGMKPL